MSSLIYLEEDNVVHNLTIRYLRNEIYTYISSIMIAVNPYEKMTIYGNFAETVILVSRPGFKLYLCTGEENMTKYRGLKRSDLMKMPPHCYAVAEEAYQMLAKSGVNQVTPSSLILRSLCR